MFFKKVRKNEKIHKRVALKNYTLGGRISTLLSLIAYILLIWSIVLSYQKDGKAGSVVGVIALISMLIGIVAFVMGIRSFYEKGTKFLRYTWFGTITSMIIMLFYIGMIISYV